MTIQDLLDQITIEGSIEIRHMVYSGDYTETDYHGDVSYIPDELKENYKILYMYAIDEIGLVIEIDM